MVFPGHKFYSFNRYNLIYNVMSFNFCHKFMIECTLKTLFYKQPVDLFSGFNSLYHSIQSKNTICFLLHKLFIAINMNSESERFAVLLSAKSLSGYRA